MASKTESPSPLRRAYFVHGEIYAESASPFPSTPTPPPMSRDVLEHLGPTLREWINTWQSTDRGRCIVVMARSSRSQPDLTALSQGPGHHMRTIRHLTHRVIAEVPHDAQGVRDALTERLNPEQNPSARLDGPSTRAPAYLTCRSKSCHSPRSSNSQPSVRRPASRDRRSTLRLNPHRAAARSLEWRIVHQLPQARRLPTCDRASAPFDHVPD
jgi:hypothetical protein